MLLESLLLAVSWPNLWARFGAVDDHIIVEMLGGQGRLSIAEIPNAVLEHFPEGNGRFRPGFWVAYVFECAWAGGYPTLWYLDRFLLLSVTAFAAYYVVTRLINPFPAALVVAVFLLGLPFEPWTRLGAAEAYAMPVLVAGGAIVVRAYSRGWALWRAWPGVSLLAAAGLFKENFVLAAALLLVGFVILFRIRRLRQRDWRVFAGAMALAALNIGAIMWFLQHEGAQYLAERNAGSLLSWTSFALRELGWTNGMIFSLAIVGLLSILVPQKLSRSLVALTATVVGFCLVQIAFYSGNAETGRYLNPLNLACLVIWAMVFHMVTPRHREPSPFPGPWRWAAWSFLVLSVVAGSATALGMARINQSSTVAFQRELAAVTQAIHAKAPQLVVLQPYDALNDQERALSMARYLRVGTSVDVSTLPAAVISDAFSAYLAKQLEQWSREGYAGDIAPYTPRANCISITFGPSKPVCNISFAAPR